MSWVNLNVSELSSWASPVESEALGLSVGRMTVPSSGSVSMNELVDEIHDLDVDLTVVRASGMWPQLGPQFAIRLPEHLVFHVDTLQYWSLKIAGGRAGLPPHIHAVADPDASAVGDLVSRIFSGYQNHYAANPILRDVHVDKAYADWAMRHLDSGGPVLALQDDGELVAVATLEVTADHVEILLAGVGEQHRGMGVYQYLLGVIDSFAVHEGKTSVVISTQAHNTAVQRAWARFGFLPMATFNTFHVMKRSLVLAV